MRLDFWGCKRLSKVSDDPPDPGSSFSLTALENLQKLQSFTLDFGNCKELSDVSALKVTIAAFFR